MSSAQAPGSTSEGAADGSSDGPITVQRTSSEADAIAKATPPKEDPLLGRTLAGKYAIVELIGEGAMGRVYRAKQTSLDKPMALKVLHRHLTGEERIAKRFHREARAASRLSHPNSLQILDFGATDDGTLYIAMELLDGEDLQTILDHDFPLSPARIGAILAPVLRALEEAHRAGVIHRDLKPENVVVLADRSGREHVKVCDFGIAKILDGEEGTSITVDGFVCGTPQYMAPEQARGDDIDHRSDIYAAGVVLYTMLCGVVPFTGETALGIITKHLMEEPVPPRRRRPDLGIPKALQAVVVKAMKKDPAERYPTAAAMADALEAAIRSLGDDANVRLGEGVFRGDVTGALEREERAAGEMSTRSLEKVAIPKSRAPQIGIGIVIAGIVIAGAAWAVGSEDAAVPVIAAAPGAGTGAEAETGSGSGSGTETETETETVAETEAVGETATGSGSASGSESGAATGAEAGTGTAGGGGEAGTGRSVGARRDPRGERGEAGRVDTGRVAPATTTTEAPIVAAAGTTADARSPGEIAFDEGRRLFLANDVPGAITRFEEAARLMPRSADVQKQLGRAYMRAGDHARSVEAYRRYLALAPDAADRAVVERIVAQHGG